MGFIVVVSFMLMTSGLGHYSSVSEGTDSTNGEFARRNFLKLNISAR